MLPYQEELVEKFLKLIPPGVKEILEIGSDMGGEVASAIAIRTGARVTGINPSPEFPSLLKLPESNAVFLREDGRALNFQDSTFDAIISVATMEHVIGLDVFLTEVARVLKPKGLFLTEFCPLWSSAKGHHVFAVVGSKEARFWKPGKNPIPDFGHLLMCSQEMRDFLHSGPCAPELIEPIIEWVYLGDSLNRCHFEEYMKTFREAPLFIQDMDFAREYPDPETLDQLENKYGKRDFSCSSISAVFRKPSEGAAYTSIFKAAVCIHRRVTNWSRILVRIMRFIALPFRQLRRKYH